MGTVRVWTLTGAVGYSMSGLKAVVSLLLLPLLTLADHGGHVHHAPLHQTSHSSVSIGGNAYAHGQSKSHGGPTVVSQAEQNRYVYSPVPVVPVVQAVAVQAQPQCTTTYEEQCSTVNEQECTTQYVDQCNTVQKKECSTPAPQCNTVEKEVCLEVNEQTCQEEDTELCNEYTETTCNTEEKEVCIDTTEQECTTVSDTVTETQKCSSAPEQLCAPVNEVKCEEVIESVCE